MGGDERGNQSRGRIHKSRKQKAGVEVSTDPKGEALGCLYHLRLLIGPGNPGPQTAIQSQKDIKEPQGESQPNLRKSWRC